MMLERIQENDDNLKLFFQKALVSIDYIAKNMTMACLTELIFSFTPEQYDKGATIFSPGEEANEMYII